MRRRDTPLRHIPYFEKEPFSRLHTGKTAPTFLYIFVLSSSGLCSAGIRTRDSADSFLPFYVISSSFRRRRSGL